MGSAGKILIITQNYPVPDDRRVWQEATSLRSAGYEVSVISPKRAGRKKKLEVIDDIYIYRHSLPIEARRAFEYVLEYTWSLICEFLLSIRVLRNRGFDVIQACNPPDLIFLIGGFYKLFFKKRFLFDHHDINPELWIAKKGRKDLIYYLLRFLERATFRVADISIATNNSYKEIAIRRGKMKEENVFVVRGTPITEEREKYIPTEKKNDLKKGKDYMVGYIGIMGKPDGVDYLLRSIEYIVYNKLRKDILFVLIGKGPEWKDLFDYSKKLKIENYVLFTGYIPDKELVEYLHACDVCVNPDVVNEFNDKSTMNKIAEYMVLGKPIVQFDMMEGRYTADFSSLYAKPNDEFDFAEKILELIDNPSKAKEMGDFGRERITKMFSWENSEKELFKAYSSVFEGVPSVAR